MPFGAHYTGQTGEGAMKEPECVVDILDDLDELADEQDEVAIADVLEGFGERSYGPILLIFALLEITPIGAIPGVPSFLALTIALIAVQMLLGGSHLWLPGFIENRSVSSDKLDKATDKLRGIAAFLDKHFHGRMTWLTSRWFRRVAAVLILLLCASVPPLEVLPFASSAPMLAIACFGLAMMVRDGLLMLVATGLAMGATGFALAQLLGSGGGG